MSMNSITTLTSDDGAVDDFYHEATTGLYESLEKEDDPSNAHLELVGLWKAKNATEHQVRHAIVHAFVKRIMHLITESAVKTQSAVETIFTKYESLVRKSIFDHDLTSKSDQVDFLLLLQRELVGKEKGNQILFFACQTLEGLEADVVEEEGFKAWWADERSVATEELVAVREAAGVFIEWLDEAEEESEEESSEEED
jgi:translation initiation factor eIF-2B subunit epsilon